MDFLFHFVLCWHVLSYLIFACLFSFLFFLFFCVCVSCYFSCFGNGGHRVGWVVRWEDLGTVGKGEKHNQHRLYEKASQLKKAECPELACLLSPCNVDTAY